MPHLTLEFLPTGLLPAFCGDFLPGSQERFDGLRESELSTGDFSFCTSVSAVFSSRIEGEDIALDSYIKHRRGGANYRPDYTRKIDDLYEAYRLAQSQPLTLASLHSAHTLLTRNILAPSSQGRWRTGNMFVLTPDGKIEYVAASPQAVAEEMERLFADVGRLLETDLSFAESFFLRGSAASRVRQDSPVRRRQWTHRTTAGEVVPEPEAGAASMAGARRAALL